MAVKRREFCKLAGLSALALTGGSASAPGAAEAVSDADRLIAEPITGKRWAMVVDLAACRKEEGCRDCIVACHSTHNVPALDDPKEEVKWIWKEHFAEAFPNQQHDYLAHDLQHEEVLMMDWHRCIGCRYCIAACPYGSRSFNWQDPRPHIDEIKPDFPTRSRGVVEKCTFCDERLAQGRMPACVEACPDKCLVFGDLEDPGSEVRHLLEKRHAIRRKPGLGTQPEVYYLV